MLFPVVGGREAYGIDELGHEDLDEGDWDLNDINSSPGSTSAIRAREVQASSTIVQEAEHTAGLRVLDTNIDLLSEQAEAPEAVATSSTLTCIQGASLLFSQNEMPGANLSKTQRILQARKSELSHEHQQASVLCEVLERSLHISRTQVLELEGAAQNRGQSMPKRSKTLFESIELRRTTWLLPCDKWLWREKMCVARKRREYVV